MSWLVVLALTVTNAVLLADHILLRQRVARLEAQGGAVTSVSLNAGAQVALHEWLTRNMTRGLARAEGGPIKPGTNYLVGEEQILPKQDRDKA